MITLKQAFAIARKSSNGVKLDPIAYDFGDSWAFGYGGTEEINGFIPVVVKKEDGTELPFELPHDFGRMENAKRVKV